MGILEPKFTLDQGIITLKHISYGNKVWMPVNHEKKISGHDDEHDEKGHLYKAQPTAGLGTRNISYSEDLVNHSNVQHEAK